MQFRANDSATREEIERANHIARITSDFKMDLKIIIKSIQSLLMRRLTCVGDIACVCILL